MFICYALFVLLGLLINLRVWLFRRRLEQDLEDEEFDSNLDDDSDIVDIDDMIPSPSASGPQLAPPPEAQASASSSIEVVQSASGSPS